MEALSARTQPHVGGKRVEVQMATAVDDDRDLGRERKARVRNRPAHRRRQVGGIDHRRGIVGEGIGNDRHALDRGDIERGDGGRKLRSPARRQAAHLQAAARRDFDRAIAIGTPPRERR